MLIVKQWFEDRSCMISGATGGGKEKWQYCVEQTNSALGFAVSAVYVRKTFHGGSKASVSKTN